MSLLPLGGPDGREGPNDHNPGRGWASGVQCVFSADEIVRMGASDALEKVCRSQPRLLQRFVPRLLAEMSRIEQASVQWHLAQILSEVPLDDQQQAQAIAVLEHNLDTCGDWIVTNCTLEALGMFAWTNPAARARLAERLHRYQRSRYKSVVSRARKLLDEFDKPPGALPPEKCGPEMHPGAR
jgi:hypothetical protein